MSVIVPVFQDREGLLRTLAALAAQTLPAHDVEVLVIDNTPEPALADLEDRGRNVRILHEPRPGSYVARNRGLREARGHVVAFTDADCEPHPDWLERVLAALDPSARTGADAVAGRIEVVPSRPRRPSALDLYEMAYSFRQDDTVRRRGFGVTANLATRRDVLEAVGPFRSDLKSNGDREWGARLRAAGFRLVYDAGVIVRHPARRTFRQAGGRVRRILGGRYESMPPGAARPFRFVGQSLYGMAAAWGAMGSLLVRGRLRTPRQLAGAVGLAAYLDGVYAAETVRLLLGGRGRRA